MFAASERSRLVAANDMTYYSAWCSGQDNDMASTEPCSEGFQSHADIIECIPSKCGQALTSSFTGRGNRDPNGPGLVTQQQWQSLTEESRTPFRGPHTASPRDMEGPVSLLEVSREGVPCTNKIWTLGTSLVVQSLRLHMPSARQPGFDPWSGN